MGGQYEDLFVRATGFSPYPFQVTLAESVEWPQFIDVETGLGKTAAIIVAWIYKRRYASPDIRTRTPRRLILCFPTRALVEQTFSSVKIILEKLGLLAFLNDGRKEDESGVILSVLWGGDVENDVDRFPERDMIIIGTQDMLLSRALNRGYAMSKFRWPAHFALLNNDCLWVMDETQLMGPGLQSSAQLEAFRSIMGTIGNHHTIWMSATMDMNAINTVDHPIEPECQRPLKIGAEDKEHKRVSSILGAKKEVRASPVEFVKDEKKSAKAVASRIKELHEAGTLTLIIVNTVTRARAIFSELKRMNGMAPIVLLHSHYRPSDRSYQFEVVKRGGDLIVVSTQVIEAGADISAKTLITDLAPWPSMVQRFGRCNRRGEYPQAKIEWFDPGAELEPKSVLPYEVEDLLISRDILIKLTDGSPMTLTQLSVVRSIKIVPVLRRKDLIDLFDTTPDLLGNELDISRFIRANDSTDVFVFWKHFDDQQPDNVIAPSPNELCSVPITELTRYLEKNDAWTWNHIDGQWSRISKAESRSLRPGQVLLLDPKKGGYSTTMGWTGLEKDIPTVIEVDVVLNSDSLIDASRSDGVWIPLKDHTAHVVDEIKRLSDVYPSRYEDVLVKAAIWHDVGKAHKAFCPLSDLINESRRSRIRCR